MPDMSLPRKLLFGGTAAVGLAAGAAGIAVAQPGDNPPAAETTGDDDQDPSYTSSVTAPEGPEGRSEADEAASLASLATVAEAQAREVALGAVPGEVTEIELDDENGNVVWSVDVTPADGPAQEVVVDAGNGDVLAQKADDENEAEGADDDAGEQEGSEADDD